MDFNFVRLSWRWRILASMPSRASSASNLHRGTRGIFAWLLLGWNSSVQTPAEASPKARCPRKMPASTMFASRLPSGGSRQFLFAFPCKHDDQARGFLDAHRGVIHEHGVGRAHEWRNLAFAIALVPLDHFVKNFRERKPVAFFLVLFPAAFRAHLRRSIQKNLQLGFVEHDR